MGTEKVYKTKEIATKQLKQSINDTKQWFKLELGCVERGSWNCKISGIFIIY